VPTLWILISLLAFETIYIPIARRLRIIAPVDNRSSHDRPTPTGGGIIIPLAAILFIAVTPQAQNAQWITMVACGLVLAGVSMYDDIRPLPPWPRLLLQIAAVAITFKSLCYPSAFDIYLLVIIFGVGCINAVNFIDGITGMLALYAIVVLGSMMYVLYGPAAASIPEAPTYAALCTILIGAMIIFGIFNICRKVFAGDVGAITLGFFIVYILSSMILAQGDATMMIFLMVCLFDAGLTTAQRLFAGENILTPHHKFIFHLLIRQWQMPHIVVSICYALLQLLINAVYFLVPPQQHRTYFIIVFALLTVTYFTIRFAPRSRAAIPDDN